MSGFRIERDDLLTALHAVRGAHARRSPNPMLGAVLLEPGGADALRLTATDLEVFITRRAPADVFEHETRAAVPNEFRVAVTLADLIAVVEQLPVGTIAVLCEGARRLALESGKTRAALHQLPVADFPATPALTFAAATMPWAELSTALGAVLWAVAAGDDPSGVFHGLSWRQRTGALYLAATDRHTLAATSLSSPWAGEQELIIPARALGAARKLFGGEPIAFGANAGGLCGWRSDAATLIVRPLDGTYPDYEPLFPTEAKTSLVLPAKDLAAAVRRVSVLGAGAFGAGVDFDLSAERCVLRCGHPDRGTVEEEIAPLAYEGEPVHIRLSAAFVSAALGACPAAEARLRLNGPRGALILSAVAERSPWRALVASSNLPPGAS